MNFILDADIQSFFDTVSQEWLIRFVEHRIGDKRIIRQIQKWLKAGVLEDGVVIGTDRGTGQDAVISPLLANIYLHYALDLWAERWRRRGLKTASGGAKRGVVLATRTRACARPDWNLSCVKIARRTAGAQSTSEWLPIDAQWPEASLRPTMPAMIKARPLRRNGSAGSPKAAMPTIPVPAAAKMAAPIAARSHVCGRAANLSVTSTA